MYYNHMTWQKSALCRTKYDKKQSEVVQKTVVQQSGGNIDSLLKRVSLFLEDEEWSSTEEYCQKVLDIDPENAEAYLGLVMAKSRTHNRDDFALVKIGDDRIIVGLTERRNIQSIKFILA